MEEYIYNKTAEIREVFDKFVGVVENSVLKEFDNENKIMKMKNDFEEEYIDEDFLDEGDFEEKDFDEEDFDEEDFDEEFLDEEDFDEEDFDEEKVFQLFKSYFMELKTKDPIFYEECIQIGLIDFLRVNEWLRITINVYNNKNNKIINEIDSYQKFKYFVENDVDVFFSMVNAIKIFYKQPFTIKKSIIQNTSYLDKNLLKLSPLSFNEYLYYFQPLNVNLLLDIYENESNSNIYSEKIIYLSTIMKIYYFEDNNSYKKTAFELIKLYYKYTKYYTFFTGIDSFPYIKRIESDSNDKLLELCFFSDSFRECLIKNLIKYNFLADKTLKKLIDDYISNSSPDEIKQKLKL